MKALCDGGCGGAGGAGAGRLSRAWGAGVTREAEWSKGHWVWGLSPDGSGAAALGTGEDFTTVTATRAGACEQGREGGCALEQDGPCQCLRLSTALKQF